jgi:hypothetical protein
MMPERPSNEMAEALPLRRSSIVVLSAGVVGLLLAAAIALWAHYGTAVFFEMIRTGFVACFG